MRGGRLPGLLATSARISDSDGVLPAEDIALAGTAALERRDVAGGNVVDMHHVEAGIDEGRHAAGRRLEDQPAGRRRLDVARADRRRGIDDHRRQALRDHLLHQPFGQQLAALIGADGLAFRHLPAFVGRFAAGAAFQRRHAGGVDDALDADALRLLHDDAGAGDVVHDDLGRIARPQPVVGRHMEEPAHAGHGLAHGSGVAQVAGDEFDGQAGQVLPAGSRPAPAPAPRRRARRAPAPPPSRRSRWPR